MATSLSSTPAPGKSRKVGATEDLQAALDSAHCGDTIELEAGGSFNTTYKLPAKPCDDAHWIVIRTSAPDSILPPEGGRINPCYAGINTLHGMSLSCTSTKNVMAKIVGQPPVLVADGANHYRLIGLELTQIPGKLAYSILNISDAADHVIVDRCWIHGTATDDSQQGVRFNSRYLAVVDSFISDIHFNGADTQAIGGPGGSGPYAIINNYLEAAGENMMFGGGAAATTPSDIEIRHNHLYKPLVWRPTDPGFVGIKFTVKDLFEVKNAQRMLVEGNIFENMWGTAIVITPKNQNGRCPVCLAADITWRYNIIRHAGAAFTIFNAPTDQGAISQGSQRISVHDNLFDDIDAAKWGGDSRLFVIGTCPQCPVVQDVSIRHNTATDGPKSFLFVHDPAAHKIPRFVFSDNIVPHGKYGVLGCGATVPEVLDSCFDTPVFQKNLVIGDIGRKIYPSGQLFSADWRGARLETEGASALRYGLAPESKYKKAASDGKDVGADMEAIRQATSGVSQW